jgi:hypothetical protein
MALTVAQLGRTNVTGNRLTVALKITPDASWLAAGELLDLTTYVSNIESVHIESTTGYVFSYDRANKKLLAWEAGADGAALDAVADATNLSALSVFITVTGGRA